MAESGYLIPATPEGFETPQYAYTVIPNVFGFGNVTENDSEPTTSIQVTNTGTDSLSFTFTDSTNFYTNDVGFTLISGQTQAFIVNAKTDTAGLHLETMFVNEINAGNKSIALSINIIPLPQFQYSVDPLTWDFGTHNQGDAEPTKVINITAEGTDPLFFDFTDSTNFYTNNIGFTMTQGQISGFTVNALTDNLGVHSEFMSINQVEAGNSNLALQSEILEVPFTSGMTTITASGNFDIPVGTTLLEYTIVAGGAGAGGAGQNSASNTFASGGGGAGGMLEGSISNPTAGLTPIVIGAGGVGGGSQANGTAGGDTIAFGFTAIGGGFGGKSSGGGNFNGGAGGSGGGAGTCNGCAANIGGAGTGGQGNNGGNSTISAGSGGGGGKGSAGTINAAGSGQASTINSIIYATGGAGRNLSADFAGANGAANTGNGGGGSSTFTATVNNGGNGGSGVVVLRWTN